MIDRTKVSINEHNDGSKDVELRFAFQLFVRHHTRALRHENFLLNATRQKNNQIRAALFGSGIEKLRFHRAQT
jgi:hypothetical protein